MSERAKLFIGLGAIAALILAALLLRDGRDQPPAPSTVDRAPSRDSPRALPPAPTKTKDRPLPPAPERAPAPSELRDETGELLSSGPAQQAELPARPEGAMDNVPSPDESEAVMTEVLDRLEADIEAAKAAGDTAKAERLEVRRARLKRKRAEQRAAAEAQAAEAQQSATTLAPAP